MAIFSTPGCPSGTRSFLHGQPPTGTLCSRESTDVDQVKNRLMPTSKID
jgi:hypothetical protein